MEQTIQILKDTPTEHNTNVKNNLTHHEEKAIRTLNSDHSIIIKEADKGGAVVIMDADYYRDKILEMLNDDQYYKHIHKNADNETKKMIDKLIEEHGQILMKEEIDYLVNFQYGQSFFYGLPKLHKSESISQAISEQRSEYICLSCPGDLKFRPIVGGPQSVTQRLSHFIDIILKPLCNAVPSFIRDDFDFLQSLPETVSEGSKLLTFDVVSLYTNIPHDLGLKAVEYWMDTAQNYVNNRFTKPFILSSLKIILERNVFYFNDQNYIQIKGTAMGTKVAPTYATLVLGYIENRLYENLRIEYGPEFSCFVRNNWKRFLDDCFLIWNSSFRVTTDDLLFQLNNLHSSIQFTKSENGTEIPFLDILVSIADNQIFTDIYCKPTDTHLYLDFFSCHPKHVKTNIPYNLASRIVTIVKDPEKREIRLNELNGYLKKQHYPDNLIDDGISKAKLKGPIIQKEKRDKNNLNNIVPFVCTFNPRNKNIFPVIKNCEQILSQSSKMKKILDKKNIIHSRRQPKNLKRILTKSRFNCVPEEEITPTVSKCTDKRCKTCEHIIEGSSVRFKNGKEVTVKHNINCSVKFIIYAIICPNCHDFYIGQTKDLRKRMTLHRQQTDTDEYRNLHVNKHIHNCADGQFKVFPFYKVLKNSVSLMSEKESFFIRTFKPPLNRDE